MGLRLTLPPFARYSRGREMPALWPGDGQPQVLYTLLLRKGEADGPLGSMRSARLHSQSMARAVKGAQRAALLLRRTCRLFPAEAC